MPPIQATSRPSAAIRAVQTLATGSFLTATVRKELDLGLERFTPLVSFAIDPQVIAVAVDSKFKTAKELLDAGKNEPNAITASITSATGTARLLLYVIERETGAKFKYVSFKSGSEATTAVAGGHTQFTPENLSEMLGLVEGKKLRVLAVTGEKRLVAVPDAPTMKELGYKIVVGTGRGFVMPAGVPKEAAAVEAALKRVPTARHGRNSPSATTSRTTTREARNGANLWCGSRRKWWSLWLTSALRRNRELQSFPTQRRRPHDPNDRSICRCLPQHPQGRTQSRRTQQSLRVAAGSLEGREVRIDLHQGRDAGAADPVAKIPSSASAYWRTTIAAPKTSSPHDHGPCWAIYGQARGETEMSDYELLEPASPEKPGKCTRPEPTS